MFPKLLPTLFFSTLFLTSSCTNPLNFLKTEITRYGYILYPTPLEFGGPGTLVGGSPNSLNLVAPPETCFPEKIDGISTDLRRSDNTTIPNRQYSVSASGNFTVKLFNFLQTGNPTISMGTNFNYASTVQLTMSGVHVEYLDSIRLTEFYRQQMSQICKDYLDKVGFIIQALKVEQMVFKFFTQGGQQIYFNSGNLNNMVDIAANVNYEIRNNTELVINTPKYIGYQLGSLRPKQLGMVLFRATSVRKGKYYFEPISIFKPDPGQNGEDNGPNPPDGNLPEMGDEGNDGFRPFPPDQYIDRFSRYLPNTFPLRSLRN